MSKDPNRFSPSVPFRQNQINIMRLPKRGIKTSQYQWPDLSKSWRRLIATDNEGKNRATGTSDTITSEINGSLIKTGIK